MWLERETSSGCSFALASDLFSFPLFFFRILEFSYRSLFFLVLVLSFFFFSSSRTAPRCLSEPPFLSNFALRNELSSP